MPGWQASWRLRLGNHNTHTYQYIILHIYIYCVYIVYIYIDININIHVSHTSCCLIGVLLTPVVAQQGTHSCWVFMSQCLLIVFLVVRLISPSFCHILSRYTCVMFMWFCVCVYLYPHISSVFVSGMVVFCALSTCWWSYSLFWLHFWARPKDVTVKNVLDFRNTTGLSAEVVRRFLEQYVLFWHRASSYLEIFICCWFCCSIYSVIPYWVILYVIACYRHIFWLFLHMLTQVVAPISRREATATSAVCAVANLDDTVQMCDLMGGGPVRPQSFSSNVNPGFC